MTSGSTRRGRCCAAGRDRPANNRGTLERARRSYVPPRSPTGITAAMAFPPWLLKVEVGNSRRNSTSLSNRSCHSVVSKMMRSKCGSRSSPVPRGAIEAPQIMGSACRSQRPRTSEVPADLVQSQNAALATDAVAAGATDPLQACRDASPTKRFIGRPAFSGMAPVAVRDQIQIEEAGTSQPLLANPDGPRRTVYASRTATISVDRGSTITIWSPTTKYSYPRH
jgi:hypothetical protein